MTNEQAMEIFNQAVENAETEDQKAKAELLREYFTNGEFRAKLEQYTFEAQE